MGESIFFLVLWVVVLFLGYKFTIFNIEHTQRHSDRYYEDLENNKNAE